MFVIKENGAFLYDCGIVDSEMTPTKEFDIFCSEKECEKCPLLDINLDRTDAEMSLKNGTFILLVDESE